MKITPLSFKNGQQLKDRMSYLPSTPQWQYTTLKFGTLKTKGPIELIWRDPLECVRYLYGNPMYRGYMQERPCKLYLDRDKKNRYYYEGNSGERLWHMQVYPSFLLVMTHSLFDLDAVSGWIYYSWCRIGN